MSLHCCLACGRVASESVLDKPKGEIYSIKDGDVPLGSKVIPFTLQIHDPRRMSIFCDMWKNHLHWNLDKSQMATDLYRHKITKRPSLKTLLLLISPLEKSSIPTDGSLFGTHSITEVAMTECDAMIVDQKHTVLLAKLSELAAPQSPLDEDRIKVNLTASWNSAKSQGLSCTKNISASRFSGTSHSSYSTDHFCAADFTRRGLRPSTKLHRQQLCGLSWTLVRHIPSSNQRTGRVFRQSNNPKKFEWPPTVGGLEYHPDPSHHCRQIPTAMHTVGTRTTRGTNGCRRSTSRNHSDVKFHGIWWGLPVNQRSRIGSGKLSSTLLSRRNELGVFWALHDIANLSCGRVSANRSLVTDPGATSFSLTPYQTNST